MENIAQLHRQIETIRRHAWGNFRDLTLAMARDPAMLVWLDGESSTKEHPNENFAREPMEYLFTCGIGHYTEKDVQRPPAFTGWHRDGAAFTFNADAHDSGRKHFQNRQDRRHRRHRHPDAARHILLPRPYKFLLLAEPGVA